MNIFSDEAWAKATASISIHISLLFHQLAGLFRLLFRHAILDLVKVVFVAWALAHPHPSVCRIPSLPTRAESSGLLVLCISVLSTIKEQNVKLKIQRPACDRVGSKHFTDKVGKAKSACHGVGLCRTRTTHENNNAATRLQSRRVEAFHQLSKPTHLAKK